MIDALGSSGTFVLKGVIGLLTVWFCWKYVPETKGKPLEKIQAIFQERAGEKPASAPPAEPPAPATVS